MHISLVWRPTRGLGKTPDEAALASRESPLPWNLVRALDATASQKAAHGFFLRLFGLPALLVSSRAGLALGLLGVTLWAASLTDRYRFT